jgi:hypothetical protein
MLGKDWLYSMKSLGDAYASMYKTPEVTEDQDQLNEGLGSAVPATYNEDTEEEMEIIDEYSVSVEDGIGLEEGKKKCKEGYKYDSDKKKCVKKKKKSSSSKTTVVVKTGGRGGYYGGGYWGGHGGSNGGGDGGDGETESNGGGDGGDGGGGGE